MVRTFSSLSNGTKYSNFKGVWPIIATPFKSNDESIDIEAFEKTINFFGNEIKCDGMTIIGVLGESNRLIDKERANLIQTAKNIAPKFEKILSFCMRVFVCIFKGKNV